MSSSGERAGLTLIPEACSVSRGGSPRKPPREEKTPPGGMAGAFSGRGVDPRPLSAQHLRCGSCPHTKVPETKFDPWVRMAGVFCFLDLCPARAQRSWRGFIVRKALNSSSSQSIRPWITNRGLFSFGSPVICSPPRSRRHGGQSTFPDYTALPARTGCRHGQDFGALGNVAQGDRSRHQRRMRLEDIMHLPLNDVNPTLYSSQQGGRRGQSCGPGV
jgi:hypothetical protein